MDRALGMDRPDHPARFLERRRHRHRRLTASAPARRQPSPPSDQPSPQAPRPPRPPPPRMRPATTRRFSPACAAAIPAPSKPPTPCATAKPTPPPDGHRRRHTISSWWARASADLPPRISTARTPARASRILILDNHDDFGGHAKRNEFNLRRPPPSAERRHAGNRQPAPLQRGRRWAAAHARHRRRRARQDAPSIRDFYEDLGLMRRHLLRSRDLRRRQTRGGHGRLPRRDRRSRSRCRRRPCPIGRAGTSCRSRPRRSTTCPASHPTEKKQRLSRMSYEAFLRDVVQVDPAVLTYYHAAHHGRMGRRHRCRVRARLLGLRHAGIPGHEARQGIDLRAWDPRPPATRTPAARYTLHFPDGNATIARLAGARSHSAGRSAAAAHAAERRKQSSRRASTIRSSIDRRRADAAAPEQHRRPRAPSGRPAVRRSAGGSDLHARPAAPIPRGRAAWCSPATT